MRAEDMALDNLEDLEIHAKINDGTTGQRGWNLAVKMVTVAAVMAAVTAMMAAVTAVVTTAGMADAKDSGGDSDNDTRNSGITTINEDGEAEDEEDANSQGARETRDIVRCTHLGVVDNLGRHAFGTRSARVRHVCR